MQNETSTFYETGLQHLLKRLGKDHSLYNDALVLQSRLRENTEQAGKYGDTETRRADRAQIIGALNHLATEALGLSFNDLCKLAPKEHRDTKNYGLKLELSPNLLEMLWGRLSHCLLGQFMSWLALWVGLLAGVYQIFDVPLCPRYLLLISIVTLGGAVILGASLMPRYWGRYSGWDHWLTTVLVIIVLTVLGSFTYTACTRNNKCPTVNLTASAEQIAPGETTRLTAKANDPENDPLAYTWSATMPGLEHPGGPYGSPLNSYTAPPGSDGIAVKITVEVDDHSCGEIVEAFRTIPVVVAPETPVIPPASAREAELTETLVLTPSTTPTPTMSVALSPSPFTFEDTTVQCWAVRWETQDDKGKVPLGIQVDNVPFGHESSHALGFNFQIPSDSKYGLHKAQVEYTIEVGCPGPITVPSKGEVSAWLLVRTEGAQLPPPDLVAELFVQELPEHGFNWHASSTVSLVPDQWTQIIWNKEIDPRFGNWEGSMARVGIEVKTDAEYSGWLYIDDVIIAAPPQ